MWKLTHIATFFHQERREVVRREVRIFAGGVGRVKMPCESEIGRENVEEGEDKKRNWKRVGRTQHRVPGRIWKEVQRCSNRPPKEILPRDRHATRQDRRNVERRRKMDPDSGGSPRACQLSS